MKLSEYAHLDATALAKLIKKGEVSKEEVTEIAQCGIQKMNDELHFVAETFTPITGSNNGALAGVPFVVKDLSVNIKGVPHHAGTRLLAGDTFIPTESNELFKHFQKAGLTTCATTTTPEFGFSTNCEALVYGNATRNPWDITKSSGGSSGGSCVAVASGAVPIAHANDAAGSIRIPAASCGLVGLKPSRGRVPSNGIFPVMGLSSELGVSRTVRDTALLLDLVQGGSAGDFVQIQSPDGLYTQAIKEKTPVKKIALMTHLKGTQKPTDAMSIVLKKTAQQLIDMGHIVEETVMDYNYDMWFEGNYIAFYSTISNELQALSQSLGVQVDSTNVEAVTLACAQLGDKLSIADVNQGWQMINATCRSVGQFMQDYDAILLPTTMGGAIPLGSLNQHDSSLAADTWPNKNFSFHPYTALFNMTGQPAISVPIGMSDGLPLGGQLVGKMGDEKSILQLASDLEQAQPWSHLKPAVSLYHL